jgi:hypothetical protein
MENTPQKRKPPRKPKILLTTRLSPTRMRKLGRYQKSINQMRSRKKLHIARRLRN